MLRKIIIGWVCLLAAIVAALALSIQAGWGRLRARVGRSHTDEAADDAGGDEAPAG